ncbi:MAG: hypothetical protein EHM93_08745 [Bacteroidales bacterium]|nr:MAG: hypothetical protein EHM93_08745 [Bacteroidales bacterium]
MYRKIVLFVLCFVLFYSCAIPVLEANPHNKNVNKYADDSLGIRKETFRGGIDLGSTQFSSRTAGYQVQFTAGFLAGKTKIGKEYNMSFQVSNGYQFKNGLGLGIGSGAERLAVPVIPLYSEITYHFIDNRFSPYFFLKAGYGFTFIERRDSQYSYEDYTNPNPMDSEGGFLFNVGVGIANFTWDKAAVLFAVGYRYQRVTETLQMWNGMQHEVESNFNRIEVKFGFMFR